MVEAVMNMNAIREEVLLHRQTLDQGASAFNEIQNELNLLTKEAKKAFTEE